MDLGFQFRSQVCNMRHIRTYVNYLIFGVPRPRFHFRFASRIRIHSYMSIHFLLKCLPSCSGQYYGFTFVHINSSWPCHYGWLWQQQQQQQNPNQQKWKNTSTSHAFFEASSMALINAVKAPEHWGDPPRSLPTKRCQFEHRQGLTTVVWVVWKHLIAVCMQPLNSNPNIAGIQDWHIKLYNNRKYKNIYYLFMFMKHMSSKFHSKNKRQQANLPAWTAKQKPRTEHPKVVRITINIK